MAYWSPASALWDRVGAVLVGLSLARRCQFPRDVVIISMSVPWFNDVMVRLKLWIADLKRVRRELWGRLFCLNAVPTLAEGQIFDADLALWASSSDNRIPRRIWNRSQAGSDRRRFNVHADGRGAMNNGALRYRMSTPREAIFGGLAWRGSDRLWAIPRARQAAAKGCGPTAMSSSKDALQSVNRVSMSEVTAMTFRGDWSTKRPRNAAAFSGVGPATSA